MWGGEEQEEGKREGANQCKENSFLVNNFLPDTLTRIFTKALSLEMEIQLLGVPNSTPTPIIFRKKNLLLSHDTCLSLLAL